MSEKQRSTWKSWRDSKRRERALRALARQLAYQEQKSIKIQGRERDVIQQMKQSSQKVRALLESFHPIDPEARVAEVGSGAHGLIYFFDAKHRVGVDPLAHNYASLFPMWQGQVPTVTAIGESLPFADHTFGVVLCDNVVDHAESPAGIVAELARILTDGGLLYFTVNIHHPIYSLASHLHSAWNSLGVSYEIGPFADHTTHLTLKGARHLFDNLPLLILSEHSNISEARA
ncbi:MAG: class I SAM-dependent methyltransferase [Pyrinomonadaceae bacterium]